MSAQGDLTENDNQSPKGIIWSAVPLPCFFVVEKSYRITRQRPREGTKSCRMGKNSVHLSARPSFGWSNCPLSKGSEDQLEGSEGQLVGSEGLQERSKGRQARE